MVESEWQEVASTLGQTITNCKKRWKSLRDTFSKYYRLELIYESNKGSSRRRQRAWVHYEQLSFLKNHVDLYRLADQARFAAEESSYSDENRKILIVNDESDERNVYEIHIKGDDGDETEETVNVNYEEEQTQEIESILPEDNVEEIYLLEGSSQKEVEVETTTTVTESAPQIEQQPIHASTEESRTITDPDERYLLSCLPAFRRFNAQQKAYVRMAIEKLFYEVEFENVSDPKSKRLRAS